MDEHHRRGPRRRGRALVGLTTCLLLGAGAPGAAATSGWTPPAVLLPAPASPDLAATSAGDSTWVFAGDRLLRGVRGRWTAGRTPYRGARMLSATADATGAVVAFETLDPVVPQHRGHQLLVGRRSWSGRWSTPVEVAQPVNSGPLPPPALLVQRGRWRVFFNEADCVDTACGGNGVFEVTDTGARRRLASVPGGSGEMQGRLVPLDAALLPGGVVALVGRDDDTQDGGTGRARPRSAVVRTRRGGVLGLRPARPPHRRHVVGRRRARRRPVRRLRPPGPGRRAHDRRQAVGSAADAPGVGPAARRAHRGVARPPAPGLERRPRPAPRLAHAPGAWSSTTVTRAGRPRSLALTAVDGRATVVYGVTTARGLEVRAQTQR